MRKVNLRGAFSIVVDLGCVVDLVGVCDHLYRRANANGGGGSSSVMGSSSGDDWPLFVL